MQTLSVFGFLWTPLFYLFWSALSPGEDCGIEGIWAVLLGSVLGFALFFLGPLVEAGGFDRARWISGFVDIVSVPTLLPLLLYGLLCCFGISGTWVKGAHFTLLWLIPDVAIHIVSWSTQNQPFLLVLVPLLRTAVGVGIPFLASLVGTRNPLLILVAILGIIVLPFSATTSYWAFFCQRPLEGYGCLAITLVPVAVAACRHLPWRRSP
ncbi:MAG: hypothetical protein LBD74_04495 [Spirochaetaceae bacterium]|jgi:hypothetical protein|nr:hypothetical protein [Spirochaetaceae bacterium]